MSVQSTTSIDVLKNTKQFLNKTVWLMGSGPSLDLFDLNLLRDQCVFALNAAITLISNNKFKNAWWIFRDVRICHQLGKKLDQWRSWRVITHLRGYHEMRDVMNLKMKNVVAYLYNKDGITHERTIIEDALQLLKFIGISQVNLIGIDHCVVKNQPYARDLMWKECFFYDPKKPHPEREIAPVQAMINSMINLKPKLNNLKIYNTSPYYPDKSVFEFRDFKSLV